MIFYNPKTIIYSPDYKHRYMIRYSAVNTTDETPFVLFIGLNPATRDTGGFVTRCKRVGHKLQYGVVKIMNLFSFRADTPLKLVCAEERNTHINDIMLSLECKRADKIIACWGNQGKLYHRETLFKEAVDRDIYCFGTTNGGSPRYLLYWNTEELVLWSQKRKDF